MFWVVYSYDITQVTNLHPSSSHSKQKQSHLQSQLGLCQRLHKRRRLLKNTVTSLMFFYWNLNLMCSWVRGAPGWVQQRLDFYGGYTFIMDVTRDLKLLHATFENSTGALKPENKTRFYTLVIWPGLFGTGLPCPVKFSEWLDIIVCVPPLWSR